MPHGVFSEEKIVVSFDRIGRHAAVPELVLPAGPRPYLKECIRTYIARHLDGEPFNVQLAGEEGFIEIGAESGGAFLLRRRPHFIR